MIELQKNFKDKTSVKKEVMHLAVRRMRQNKEALVDVFDAIDAMNEMETMYWIVCEDDVFCTKDKEIADEYKQMHKSNLLFMAVLFRYWDTFNEPYTQMILSMHEDLWQRYMEQNIKIA